MYRLVLAQEVTEQIINLSPFVRKQIEEVFAELVKDPYASFGAMRMRGGGIVRYRCKVGDHRVVYRINENSIEVYVLKVGHRSTVYIE